MPWCSTGSRLLRHSVIRKGSHRSVPSEEWRGRRENARAYLRSAQALLDLADEDDNGNPIMSQAISAAIAFADATSIQLGGIQNDGEHSQVVRTLRAALGARADAAQLRRLGQIIGRKDTAQYGHRASTIAEARRLVEQATRFAEWAEGVLAAG